MSVAPHAVMMPASTVSMAMAPSPGTTRSSSRKAAVLMSCATRGSACPSQAGRQLSGTVSSEDHPCRQAGYQDR